MDADKLTDDAILFGLAYLNGPKAKLSFGGEGAEMEITPRAEAALQNLIETGYCIPCEPDTSIAGRRYYCGVSSLGAIAKERIKDPFSTALAWPNFVKKQPA